MLLTFLTLSIFSASVYLTSVTENELVEFLTYMSSIFSGIFLVCHFIAWPLLFYSYEDFKQEGEDLKWELAELENNNGQIVITVDGLRNTSCEMNVIINIIEWNNRLVDKKETNKSNFFGCYANNKIECLEIIKLNY